MNIRKILYLPKAEHAEIIVTDNKLISGRCSEIADTERKEQKENQKSRDNKCPKCRTTGGNKIVDRIASVEGGGNVDGHLFGVHGRMSIETKPVNHCNVCNHEWEKFKTKAVTELAVMKVILNYLSDFIRDPERNSRYSWKIEAIKIFEGCHAESIHYMQTKYKRSVRYPVSVRQLRRRYKSIFDTQKS